MLALASDVNITLAKVNATNYPLLANFSLR